MLTVIRLFIAASILLLLSTAAAAADDSTAIHEAFSAYRSAILAGNGASATAYLSSSTFEYYDQMRELALDGDLKTVQGLSLINQMQVLMLRLRVPPDQLGSMTPHELVAHAVNEGWIGKNSVLAVQPGRVLSEKNVAVLHAIVNGQDAGPAFRFNRESGAWRLDLVPTIQAANAGLQMAIKREGVSESEFMITLIESVVGRKIGAEAWEPVR